MEQTGKRKKKKGIVAAVIIILLLGGGAVGITSCMKGMTEAMNSLSNASLETVKAEKRDISNTISVSGTVESENIVKVTSKLSAKVKTLNVEVGMKIDERSDCLLKPFLWRGRRCRFRIPWRKYGEYILSGKEIPGQQLRFAVSMQMRSD